MYTIAIYANYAVGAYVHSLKVRVSAEGVQKQQHQVKDEAVLLLLED